MDLVAGIRKEGSRGGRDSFKWSDVKESSHRENYLGHSLMAPVGRWQQGRDLNWYAKNKDGDSQQHERNEELRRIKEAEQDAMARALGLPVAPRSSNANMTPLGGNEVRKAIQESTDADDKDEAGRGIGFGSYGGLAMDDAEGDTLAAIGIDSQPRSREQEEGRSFREIEVLGTGKTEMHTTQIGRSTAIVIIESIENTGAIARPQYQDPDPRNEIIDTVTARKIEIEHKLQIPVENMVDMNVAVHILHVLIVLIAVLRRMANTLITTLRLTVSTKAVEAGILTEVIGIIVDLALLDI
ncbi:hypothetical protein UA08_01396 [Talaromyces atroroseus]|uniref:Multiple myeloma tumor-associated protein 2-like N-terminal domain-containing protein n=1 Tax=Talaromyces atroroseus TaxID=1441469 RepID=A0A1Q5QAZ5_TALAT|nr:hypothetical protein UA08_01396 [Talaromyces atroroseus]OKL63105.1 hypothetical protein UA08_01396 [Talaromyces atroroseus]